MRGVQQTSMKSCGGSKFWSCDTEDHPSDDRDGRERLKKNIQGCTQA